jgi:hypothetical protein
MKKTSILISIALILLALPALSHISMAPSRAQSMRNTALNTDSAILQGTVDVSTLPDSPGPSINTNPLLSLVPKLPTQTHAAAAAPAFQIDNVLPGSSYINVAKSIEGTPGYNPNPCLCAPSDMGLASSSQYVFQMVNLAGTVYTTSGTVAKPTFSLSDFWFLPVRGGPIGIGMSDPQVLFDARAGRWFASILDTYDVNRIRFAVSASNNPLGIWYIYRVIAPTSNAADNSVLPDQPWIGYSDDKFLISANDFQFDPTFHASSYLGAQYWILNKLQMMAGNYAIDTQTISPDPSQTSIRPMPTLSSTSDAYMAENCITVIGGVLDNDCTATITGTDGGITVFTVSGLPPAATVTTTTVPIRQGGFPNNATEPGLPPSQGLATNDDRITSAVWNHNVIWTAFNDGNNGGACTQASCVRLDAISTPVTSASLLQDFAFVSNGASTFYGAVSTDTSNNLVVMFETSSSIVYPSLLVTGQLTTAAPDTLAPSRIVQAGSASDLTGRWGDYFYAATQPGSPSTFWVAGDYRTITLFQGWQTRIGKITFSTSPPPCGSSSKAIWACE